MSRVRDRAASVRHLKDLVRHPQRQQNDRRRATNIKIEQKRNEEVDAFKPEQHRVHAHHAGDRSRSTEAARICAEMKGPEEAHGTEPGDQVIREITPSSEHFLHDVAGDRQYQHVPEQVAPTNVHEHRSQPRDRLGLVNAEHKTLGHQAGSYFVEASALAGGAGE